MKLRVKEICKEKGITQKQLAEKIGVAEISLSRSINTNPTLSTMENIATALGVKITELFSVSSSGGAFACPHCGKGITIKVE